jgi:hypothetical protein
VEGVWGTGRFPQLGASKAKTAGGAAVFRRREEWFFGF